MRKTTKNKVAMYKAVKTVVTNNSAAWTGLPAFVNVFTQFGEKLNLLEQHANNQTLALIGVSAVKEVKRKEAAEKAYAVCSSLGAYAVLSNNVGLINQMKIGKWDLLKGGSLKTIVQAHYPSSEFDDVLK